MVITIIVINSTMYSEYVTIRNSRDLLSERMDELSAYSIKLSPYRMRDIAFRNRVSLPNEKAYCYTKLMATDSSERIKDKKVIVDYEYYIAIAVISGDAQLLADSSFGRYVEAVRHMEDVKEASSLSTSKNASVGRMIIPPPTPTTAPKVVAKNAMNA